MDQNTELKSKLLQAIKGQIEYKLNLLHSEFAVYRESAANETKSTAGDKHDTSRSMMQLEQEKMGKQLNELNSLKGLCDRIDTNSVSEIAGLGSIVYSNHGNFYLSVSVQAVIIDGINYMPLSMQSPLGRILSGQKKGYKFELNSKQYEITKVI